MQNITLRTDFDSMSGVIAALKTDDHVHVTGQNVNKFSFTFVTPLGAHKNINRHFSFSYILVLKTNSITYNIKPESSNCK